MQRPTATLPARPTVNIDCPGCATTGQWDAIDGQPTIQCPICLGYGTLWLDTTEAVHTFAERMSEAFSGHCGLRRSFDRLADVAPAIARFCNDPAITRTLAVAASIEWLAEEVEYRRDLDATHGMPAWRPSDLAVAS